jgi:hypothetical protein
MSNSGNSSPPPHSNHSVGPFFITQNKLSIRRRVDDFIILGFLIQSRQFILNSPATINRWWRLVQKTRGVFSSRI